MNDRIRELAQQAVYYDKDEESWEFDREKFAELIVGECAKIALKSGHITNKDILAKVEAERIYHKIQEHFGVEE